MNRDIRLSTEFWDHPKTVKLERRLGLQGPKSLQILWAWAAKYHPDGRLEGEDVEAIEIAAKWPGNDRSTNVNDSLTPLERTSTFVGTLLTLRWIDQDEDGTFSLHDWHEHNAWAANVDERSDKARLSRMGKTHPDIYKELVNQGKRGVTKEEYESLTIVKRKGNAPLTPAPAPAPSPSPNEKTSSLHPEAVQLAVRLIDRIHKTNPKAKTGNPQTWAKHTDRMLRLDGRTVEEVEAVIDWCQRDSFWCSNILSTKKLREKFDQLTAQMNRKLKVVNDRPDKFAGAI